MGKHKKERTEQIQRIGRDIIMAGQAQNSIEQHNLDRLIRQGVIVRDENLKSRGGGPGRRGLEVL